jgi:catechol 2,3-dioxygenase-like lactoylglutathione lyase family enzyme
MITALDHLVLHVADIDRTVDFYCRGLGMEKRVFGNGRIAMHFGDQKFNLHEADGAPILPRARNPVAGSVDFCLVSDRPIEEVMRLLGERGIAIERGPVDQTGARGPMRSVYMRDPDGNLVEICVYRP